MRRLHRASRRGSAALAIFGLGLAAAAQAQLSSGRFEILTGSFGTPGDHAGSAFAVGDFNGDGLQDLAVGHPDASGSGGPQVGRVAYFLGNASGFGSNGFFTPPSLGLTSEAGARFGAALAAGDFNGDGFDDLAIGMPGKIVSGDDNAGEIAIVYAHGSPLPGGPPWSLGAAEFFSQANLAGAVEAGDSFGYSLAAGDLNDDEVDDLVVGVPFEDIVAAVFGNMLDAGAVNVIYGVDGVGLTTTDNLVLHLEVGNVSQNAETDDNFGFSLAIGDFTGDLQPDLAVGIPGDFIGGFDGSGSVLIFETDENGIDILADERLFSQADPNILGTPAAGESFGFALATGDFDGNGRTDLAVGVPGTEGVTTFAEQGAVQVFYGYLNGLSTTNDQFFTEESGGLPFFPAAFDRWGEALAVGDFDANGFDDLAIGAPLVNWLGVANSGVVNVFYGSSPTFGLQPAGYQSFSMASFGTLAVGDEFGFALATGHFANSTGGADLIVGVPNLEVFGSVQRGAVVAIRSGFPFLDGFETGDTSQWSVVVP